jgi:Na+-transporting methylmalonyl-CoA/oxaloacetate decarboxylase gamma subunit
MMLAWRIARAALLLLGVSAIVVIAVMAVVYLPRFGTQAVAEVGSAFSRAEFITIILAAVTVILAALTIVIAAAAVVGYVAIRDAATKAADKTASAVAAEKAEEVATRVAEQTVRLIVGSRQQAGDDIAKAAGEDDVGAT